MNMIQYIVKIAMSGVMTFFILQTSPAIAREFTDTKGRTVRGELVSTQGDTVTIQREDGQTFTVPMTNFSDSDIAYFKKPRGTKTTASTPSDTPTSSSGEIRPTPPPVVVGTLASKALPRIDVKVMSKKKDQLHGYSSNEQNVSYHVDVKNTETSREVEKASGVIMVFARSLNHPADTQVIACEDFKFSVNALATYAYEMKQSVRLHYDSDSNYGWRSAGYLVVVKDSTGKVLSVVGSSETITKNYQLILKLKLNNVFGKDYKMTRESGSSFYN